MDAQQPVELGEGFEAMLVRVPHDKQERLQLHFQIQIFDVAPGGGWRAVVAGADAVGGNARGEVVDVVILREIAHRAAFK